MTDYGTDISCLNDIASDGRTVTGTQIVAEAIYRRLTTPRGRLIKDPNYGFNLADYVNADMSARDIAGMMAGIQAECKKDERVSSVKAVATLLAGVLTITIESTMNKETLILVIGVSSTSVELLTP